MERAPRTNTDGRGLLITWSFQFRRFKWRVLAFVVGLLMMVQAGVFLAVDRANVEAARRQINESLEVTANQFQRNLAERNLQLLQAARLLSSDYAFKQAYATRDHGTIVSALENHATRAGAQVMLLLDLDQWVLADTLHSETSGRRFGIPALIDSAEADPHGEATDVGILDDKTYQLVVVPLFTPAPSAWIVIGFRITDTFANSLKKSTRSEVSLVRLERETQWHVFASTLSATHREALVSMLLPEMVFGQSHELVLDDERFVSLATPILPERHRDLAAVLQRPLEKVLAPYQRLRVILLVIALAGLAISLGGGLAVANSVTRPVEKLADGARRIGEGDYAYRVVVDQRDEFGELAGAFNNMVQGLEERDRVRDLLGKVVSHEVADELLRRKIELGGEEREVTVLFSDVRDFTRLSETHSPSEILNYLNTYLTKVSGQIEKHGGIVDKYIGDAVMALFGAPLQHADDPARAVAAAVAMCKTMRLHNIELKQSGLPPMRIGVGINTARVVAGNVGSASRLNYTVVGDGVNVASRLEGLTKTYGVDIIVSESTRALATGFLFRELDRVCVKGKSQPVALFEPLGPAGAIDSETLARVERFEQAIRHFRARAWPQAEEVLLGLLAEAPEEQLYALYLEQTRRFQQEPPPAAWVGSAYPGS